QQSGDVGRAELGWQRGDPVLAAVAGAKEKHERKAGYARARERNQSDAKGMIGDFGQQPRKCGQQENVVDRDPDETIERHGTRGLVQRQSAAPNAPDAQRITAEKRDESLAEKSALQRHPQRVPKRQPTLIERHDERQSRRRNADLQERQYQRDQN